MRKGCVGSGLVIVSGTGGVTVSIIRSIFPALDRALCSGRRTRTRPFCQAVASCPISGRPFTLFQVQADDETKGAVRVGLPHGAAVCCVRREVGRSHSPSLTTPQSSTFGTDSFGITDGFRLTYFFFLHARRV